MWQTLTKIDRRIIYVMMIFIIALALIKPIGLAIVPGPETKRVFEFIDSLPSGSIVYLGFEYGAGGIPELMPPAQSLIRQGFKKGLRFVSAAMWVQGGDLADMAFSIVPDEFPDKKYGIDWINIGYKPGQTVLLQKMLSSIYEAAAGRDHYGNDLKTLPLAQEVPTIKDVDALFVFITGTPGEREYVAHVTSPHNLPLLVSIVSVSVPQVMPLIQSGQVHAGVFGMKGGAEYEVLVGHPGNASAGMDAQSFSHALIILFIILGNLGHFFSRKN